MKIGLLTQEYHLGENRFGGVGRAFGKMANWLAEHGHEVTVYFQDRQSGEIEERPGLRVVRVGRKPSIHWRLSPLINQLPASVKGWIWRYECNAALTERILEDYGKGRIEVLLSNRAITAPYLMLRKLIPSVVRMQYSYLQKQQIEGASITLLDMYNNFIERKALKKAERIYAPSQFAAEYARKLCGRNVVVIRTPMFDLNLPVEWETVRRKYNLPDHFYLYWGGLIRVKGIQVLAKALPEVFKQDPDGRMVIVGSRMNRDKNGNTLVHMILAEAGKYRDRIHLVPSLDQAELFAIIKQADVAIFPSIIDNLPNALLEAMYFGKLIVASRGASLNEMIEDGRDGLLFEIGNFRELAAMMLRAARMGAQDRNRFGLAVAEKVRTQCSPMLVIPQVVALCRDAVAEFNLTQRGHSPRR